MEILATTDRLHLRNWTTDDIDAYAEMVADPEVMKFIGEGVPRGRDYAEEFVRQMIAHQESRGWMRFAVEIRESGELAGFCGFDDKDGRLDFGWRYARQFWGRGYGGEAALAALDLGRDRFGLRGIESMSYPENIGSMRIFEKLGMSYLRTSEVFGREVVHYGYPDEQKKDA